MFAKDVEYKGRVYNVVVDVNPNTQKLFINNEEILPIVKQFRNMRSCFAKRAVLNDDEVVVIVYGKYVSIEECPHDQIDSYLQKRFAPPLGSPFIFTLISVFAYSPVLGAVSYLMEHINLVWLLPYVPLIWLGFNSLYFLSTHPRIGKVKRMLIWLATAILINVIAYSYLMFLVNTQIKP